ncbi:RES family NAD+ phosphorylase [Desulfoluna spongiiphila]|uniref:RES domain-containing protein n=1 Tax=Desulfoluna spongiiphila TaxID=419481 RepID=A0A1G5CUF0_9BACT|nr:RES family NAD+ phosphorylase [Desulfoluna spongiiphila]SCY05878.1 RES domain-containing protein [Desulfoluna spongiiphila]
MITLYRITSRRFGRDAAEAFSGDGARLYPGRWNSGGTPVVYTAETLSLAMLEMLVHLDEAMLAQRYVYFTLEVPDASVISLSPLLLPEGWASYPAPSATRQLGDAWLLAGEFLALKVPSALNPVEHTFLINPSHPDFSHCTVSGPISFVFDERLKDRT